MANKRNPLSGAFSSPPAANVSEEKKAPEQLKMEAIPKPPDTGTPVKPAEDKKPAEPAKDEKADKTPAADGPAKPTEEKKPSEPPKDEKTDKPPAADSPAKPAEDKKPSEPSKDKKTDKPPAADGPAKPAEEKKPPEQPKDGKTDKAPAADGPAKPDEDKKPPEPSKDRKTDKAPAADGPAKPAEDKKPPEQPKDGKTDKVPTADSPAKPAEDKKPPKPPKDEKTDKAPAADGPAKPTEEKKPPEQPKDEKTDKAPTADSPAKPAEDKKLSEAHPNAQLISLDKIKPLPGTYVKDTPRKDYSDLIASIKKDGLQQPIILRQGEKGDYQLVHGFHRYEAMKQAGMQEISAEVYNMNVFEASAYRKDRDKNPPIPGTIVPPTPTTPPEKGAEEPPQEQTDELPKNLHIPLTPEGKPETVNIVKISELHAFEGHPFNVNEDKDMWDLVESIKQFGVLEPVTVIPRKEGGYEMVSGHRRRRACELAGIENIPVIVRQLDRDEATIAMVDANLKRENITPMEKARAYKMKLEAMKRKAGRRSKQEVLEGKKPMRADEVLAQQTGESRATIQRLTRLTELDPKLQEMVDKKQLPVNTAADISFLKKEEQKALADSIEKEGGKVPSGTQAAELKKQSQEGTLTPEKIEKAVAPTKREVSIELKVSFTDAELRPYFPEKTTTPGEAKKAMFEAMNLRQKALERQKAQAAEKVGKPGKPKKPPAPSR